MKLGIAQIRVEGGSPQANKRRAFDAIEETAANGADLIVLPELWRVGYFAADSYADVAEPLDGPLLNDIATLATSRNVHVLAGSIIEALAETEAETPADRGYANTSVLIDNDGNRLARYRKHHLFGYESEEASRLVPGNNLGIGTVGEMTVGITTCYDLRFPELYRSLVDAGAQLVLVPSAWPFPRVEHWKTLTKARALENLCYVAAVNGTGPAGGDGLIGRSRVIDPWGQTVRTAGPGPERQVVSVDPDRVRTVRAEFPALRDRRGV